MVSLVLLLSAMTPASIPSYLLILQQVFWLPMASNHMRIRVFSPRPRCHSLRYLGCAIGINVTASHNPSKYNGYKVYGPDGCQIASEIADAITQAIEGVDMFDDVRTMPFEDAQAAGLATYIQEEVLDAFLDAVYDQHVEQEQSDLRVVYTPLNGTGLECVTRILERIGVTDIHVVEEQSKPDGNFPTCPYPNPEIREALECGIALCEQVHPDLLLATDPDADRVGIAVKDGNDYQLLSGNEVGVLLLDFICRMRKENGTLPEHPVAVTTIVSTSLVDSVAAKYGVDMRRVLIGFKYIGGVIADLEQQDEKERFIFGFEESYGYLAGTHARDKDAVVASMLICQMARYYRTLDRTFTKRCKISIASLASTTTGPSLMHSRVLRVPRPCFYHGWFPSQPLSEIAGYKVEQFLDYQQGVGGLPSANGARI